MTPEEFVKGFYIEKKTLINQYFDSAEQSAVGELINSMELDEKGKEQLRQIINGILTDGFYNLLLGIDGEATIGETQELYKLIAENGNELTGEIEANAWEYFQNHKYETDNSKADFIAELEYELESGRTRPAISGYRPQIKFEFDDMQTSGIQRFIDRELVFPGDQVVAEVTIVSVDYFATKLEEGMKFEFREGLRKIGNGKILTILNKTLEKI